MTRYVLRGIGIENFRVFKEYQYFDLKPITILTGTNNSGKSTLGKALALLSTSYSLTNFNKLILKNNHWNFGHWNDNLSKDSNDSFIKFDLFFNTKNETECYQLHLEYEDSRLHSFSLKKNEIIVNAARISNDGTMNFTDTYIHFDKSIINDKQILEKLFISEVDLTQNIATQIVEFLRRCNSYHVPRYDSPELLNFNECQITRLLKRSKVAILAAVNREFDIIDRENCYTNYKLKDVLNEDVLSKLSDDAQELELLLFLNNDYDPTHLVEDDLFKAIEDINDFYFENNVNDIVISKQKYPNLYDTLLKFKARNKTTKDQNIQEILYDWVVRKLKMVKPSFLRFEQGFTFENDKNVSYNRSFIRVLDGEKWGDLIQVEILSDEEWVNVASLGFGTSNLIFKILQIILVQKLMIVEEPEANLHPSLQSRLADLITASTELVKCKYLVNDFNIKVDNEVDELDFLFHLPITGSRRIIETHSEYLIRRLQYLVASVDSPLSADDVQIYYFNNPLEENYEADKRIIDIKINENGGLTEPFGTGFMDEADNIALELYLLQYK